MAARFSLFSAARPPDDGGDRATIAAAASALGLSEFEVFRHAYRHWFGRHGEPAELEAWFGRYLNGAPPPPWVRHFARRPPAALAAPAAGPGRSRNRPPASASTPGAAGGTPLPRALEILIGCALLLLLAAVLAGLVLIASPDSAPTSAAGVAPQAPPACLLPPCY